MEILWSLDISCALLVLSLLDVCECNTDVGLDPVEPRLTSHKVFLTNPDQMKVYEYGSCSQIESLSQNIQVNTDILSHNTRVKKEMLSHNRHVESLSQNGRQQMTASTISRYKLSRVSTSEHHFSVGCGPACGGGREGGSGARLEDALSSLARLLVTVARQEMLGCDLLVAFDDAYHQRSLLHHLLQPDTIKQVWHVNSSDDLLQASWSSPQCRGYLLLIHDLHHLTHFTETHHHVWDYHGRYIVLGSSVERLEAIVASRKGRNTEHLVGLVQVPGVRGEWALYRAQVLRTSALHRVATWRGSFLTPDLPLFPDQLRNLQGLPLKVPGVRGEWALYRAQVLRTSALHRVATWRGSFLTPDLPLFPDQLRNLQGLPLKVVTFAWEPNVFYHRDSKGLLLHRYGVDIDVTNSLARFFNFTVQFQEPARGELWGEQQENGSWTGMMGFLARGEAHLGAASVYVSAARAPAADFTAPYDSRMSCFMARTEQQLPRWHALAYPFHVTTWLALLLAFLVMAPLLLLMARASRYIGEEATCLQLPGFTWLYSFGLHVREPQATLPRTTPMQVLLAFLLLYTMILTLAYSTNLTAYLIVTKTPASMETIRELRDSALEVAGLGNFYRNALASASDPDLQNLTRQYKGHKSVESIFPRVLEGRAVFLQNRAYIEFISLARFTKRGVSSMRIMKECFAPYSIALALQRHSPLKKFDRVIGLLQQSGLIRQFFLNSLRLATSTEEYSDFAKRGAAQDPAEGGDGITALTLDHLQGIFFIAFLGWFLSALAFVVELKIR
ncbi:probable glutamate receptor [Panulirus ornatus]|uniref:probable glutamate receptor n=1 Tax=Panulirus ornatus TaxID=150431 RepID=UPI003A8C3EB0